MSSRGIICFTNPDQIRYIYDLGIYGNVSSGDRPRKDIPQSVMAARKIRFGKLKDLLNLAPGNLVFFFEKNESKLHGVWQICDEPFFVTSPALGKGDSYPYRFYMQRFLNFPDTVPVMELRKYLDKDIIWSMRTFEREVGASFFSINPISTEETDALLDLFYTYNHRIDASSNIDLFEHPPLKRSINFCDLVLTNRYSSPSPLIVKANNFGQYLEGVPYEDAIHCCLIFNLVRGSKHMRTTFGNYKEVLREVPVSSAGQHRIDIVLIYENPKTQKPSVFSLIEIKRGLVNVNMLKQLLDYIKLFSKRHNLDTNSLEGIYIGSDFDSEAKDYAEKRGMVETERPLRLIKYELEENELVLYQAY